ncbi:MAG: hypothetical protein GF383_08625 [Candidatus Lokiarchaeota archaeon]|nr:hypothetical protein [Candidatus Lokiarchaeota archaeon]
MNCHIEQLKTISTALKIIKQYNYLDPKTLAERIFERLPNIRNDTIDNIKRAVIIAFKFNPIRIHEILTEINTIS